MTLARLQLVQHSNELVAIYQSWAPSLRELVQFKVQARKEFEEQNSNRHLFVYSKEKLPIACVQLILANADNDPDLANGSTLAHVHALRVHFEYQKQGVATKVMKLLERKCQTMGIKALTLGVDDSNQRAIRLYHNLGYKIFKSSPGRAILERCLYMKKRVGVS